MTAVPPESDDNSLPQHAIPLLSGLAGIAIILGLFGYTLLQVIGLGGTTVTDVTIAPTVIRADAVPLASAALAPPVASGFSRLLILMLCDGETAFGVFPDAIHFRFISLGPSNDRDALSDLLSGVPTRFPSNAIIYQSPCARAGIERGDFP